MTENTFHRTLVSSFFVYVSRHHIDGKEAIEFRIRFMKSEGDPANSYDYPEDRYFLFMISALIWCLYSDVYIL